MEKIEIISPDKIKDVLITRTAIKLLQSESVVEKVIGFQFKDALQMTRVHHQVEISGFGKLLISGTKVKKRIEKLEKISTALRNALENPEKLGELKTISYTKKLESATETLEYLKTRKNGYEN
jgi:hypothetical protein